MPAWGNSLSHSKSLMVRRKTEGFPWFPELHHGFKSTTGVSGFTRSGQDYNFHGGRKAHLLHYKNTCVGQMLSQIKPWPQLCPFCVSSHANIDFINLTYIQFSPLSSSQRCSFSSSVGAKQMQTAATLQSLGILHKHKLSCVSGDFILLLSCALRPHSLTHKCYYLRWISKQCG